MKEIYYFHVPDYYIYSIPSALVIALIFLIILVFVLDMKQERRGNALNKLELVLAKEQELESIGHQAAAAAHSLGTPLSTITVIAKELKKEIVNNNELKDDVDTILEQAKKCGDILKKISQNQIVDDEYVKNITLQDLLFEITKSFESITEKNLNLNLENAKKKFQ